MRHFLIGVTVIVAVAAAFVVGGYCWFSCTLPPMGRIERPPARLVAGAPVNPDGSPNWRARTLIDLAAARQMIWDHTPVPYDAENPQYRAWAVQGFAAAEARAEQASDLGGYFYTIAAYINGFRDPHIAVNVTGELPARRWPGFIVSQQGEAAKIVYRDANDASVPPLGAKVVQCEGKALAALVAERVYPFRYNPALAAERRQAVTRLFLDRGNPFAPPPAQCRFEIEGRVVDAALNWRALPKPEEAWTAEYVKAGRGPSAPWGVSEVAPGVFWIGVPTFSSGQDTAPKLEALIAEVEKKGAAMRQARSIAIDTRGNGGGNSTWADRLAVAVFTPEVLDRFAPPTRKEAVDWRASPGNAAYWRAWSDEMVKEFGAFSMQRFQAVFLDWQLSRSAANDPPLWRLGDCQPAASGGMTKLRPRGPSPFPARVYFLSNGSCGSSCLNFADQVLMVPGVQLIGSATSGDGAYMEVRSEELPSKLAALTFPQKVSRGGGRGSLEVYEADVAYDGLWSDEAVRAWVMALANGR